MKLLKNKTVIAVISVLFCAIIYALSIPLIKLLNFNAPLLQGGLLYFGAGFGIFLTTIFKKRNKTLRLTLKELPYLISMILLDISAITFLVIGISKTNSSNVSLLSNFELVATSLVACLFFKEAVSKKLFGAIILICIACTILSFEGFEGFIFNQGSIFVLLATLCWGIENNCTRCLSIKDVREITIIKGVFAGFFGIVLSLILKETVPDVKIIILTMLIGFISYGVSVSLYIFSQRHLGAAKTGAYYSIAPYAAVILSLVILGEKLQMQFFMALFIMIIAGILVIQDTLNA